MRKAINAIPPVVPPVSETGHPDDDDEGDTESLSAREVRFCDALATGQTLAQAAKAIGLSARSGRRWKVKPQIVEGIRARLAANVSVGRAILSSGMARASRALVAMSDGTEAAESARVSACRAVVENALELRFDEMAARLAYLESRLEGSQRENLPPEEMAARFVRATRIAQEIMAAKAAGPKVIEAVEVGAPPVAPAVPPAGLATIEAMAAPAPVLSSVPMPWAQPVQRLQHPQAQSQVGVPSK
jgi:hypothetical protein